MTNKAIAAKYAKQISRSQAERKVSQHKKHIGKRPKQEAPPVPGTLPAIKEERHRKSVEDRQDEIYQMAFDLIKKAASKGDIRGAASCLAQATAITGQMAASNPGDPHETESDGYIEAVRATAKDDWKDARAISVEASEQKTKMRPELVDA